MPPGQAPRWDKLLAPFRDWRFRRLLLFGCWFSCFNGITQSALNLYPATVLGFHVLVVLTLRAMMRLGQWGLSPWAGRLADRWGNRPVLMASLLLVAQGPLFYLLATPERPWWIVGAWAVWIAYVGLNVALPNLMLKLSPAAANLPYIASYYTIAGLCYGVSTVVGGALCDCYGAAALVLPGGMVCGGLACLFFLGWITRMLGAVVLLCVVEPKRRHTGR